MVNIKTVNDVMEFEKKIRLAVGEFEAEMFSVELFGNIDDVGMESPIEQMLYISLKSLLKINRRLSGLIEIQPQKNLGPYRVDFFICSYLKNEVRKLIVECDSQQFHERTETERRYEKKRDRYLQGLEYKIFHFTGKEIKDNPLKVSAEILTFLTGEEDLIDPNYLGEWL